MWLIYLSVIFLLTFLSLTNVKNSNYLLLILQVKMHPQFDHIYIEVKIMISLQNSEAE